MQDNILATDAGSRAGAEPSAKRSGFWYNWGPQAWIDMWMSNTMLVKRAMPIVTHTFLPILRLSGDKEQIDRDFAAVRALREEITLFEAPREKWRKRYGNFVREVEWALLELRKYYSQAQYEEIVIGTAVALSHETSADFLKMMNSGTEKSKLKQQKALKEGKGASKPTRLQKWIFDTFNPAGWLTGAASVTEINPATGTTIMEIPDCAWHTCARQDSLPNPDALPQEGCLLICKGPFEALFNGSGGGMKMEFDPHLPETSCTVRMTIGS